MVIATRHAIERAKERLAPLLTDNVAAANMLAHLWAEAKPATEAQLNRCVRAIDPRCEYRLANYAGGRYLLVAERHTQLLITVYEYRGKL